MFAASQMHQIPPILKLTSGGLPLAWVSWQEAAGLYARDRVRWEAGEVGFDVHGGRREDGADLDTCGSTRSSPWRPRRRAVAMWRVRRRR
jgi:hypothetical protein